MNLGIKARGLEESSSESRSMEESSATEMALEADPDLEQSVRPALLGAYKLKQAQNQQSSDSPPEIQQLLQMTSQMKKEKRKLELISGQQSASESASAPAPTPAPVVVEKADEEATVPVKKPRNNKKFV